MTPESQAALIHDLEEIGKAADQMSKVTRDHNTDVRAMHVPETLNLIAKLCDTLQRNLK